MTEKIDKVEKRLNALESRNNHKNLDEKERQKQKERLEKKIESLKAARIELLDAGDVNQIYHFKKEDPREKTQELWELRAILENTGTFPVDQVDLQASNYVMTLSEATTATLKSMIQMLDKGHYEFPELRATIETRLSQRP